jgi:5-methylcytosine-specific restriction enzyme subunit McrC
VYRGRYPHLKNCLTYQGSDKGVFQTKPDILIRRDGEVVQVIDTKWKRISSQIDDDKQGVSQSDIYQMMAYAQLYKAPRLTLLYPHHEGLPGVDGIQGQFWIIGEATALETASIDVALGTDDDIMARLKKMLIPASGEHIQVFR